VSIKEFLLSKDVVLVLFGAVVGAVIAFILSTIGTYWLWQEQVSLEQHNIASALYYDVQKINQSFNRTMVFKEKTDNEARIDHPNAIIHFVQNTPYYSSDGLYYAFQHDISKFDKSLSQDIYLFYEYVNDIETRREYLSEMMGKYPSFLNYTKMEQYQFNDSYETMYSQIEWCLIHAPSIEYRLSKE
jgi:hypothetical protein